MKTRGENLFGCSKGLRRLADVFYVVCVWFKCVKLVGLPMS